MVFWRMMDREKYDKPLPISQPESDYYWEKAREHELWLKNCDDCNKTIFYPRDICPYCFSRNTIWIKSKGQGILFSYAIVFKSPVVSFQRNAPFIIAIVELEEGVKIPTNLIGINPIDQNIRIGMPVEVTFDDVTNNYTLPKFRPSEKQN
jgi:uncharacterized OB-fold protein